MWGLDEMWQPILVVRGYLLHMCEQKLSLWVILSAVRGRWVNLYIAWLLYLQGMKEQILPVLCWLNVIWPKYVRHSLNYSADLTYWDFWLFLKLKIIVKISWMKLKDMTKQLMAILKEDFADCFQKWKGFWDNWARSQDYFEKDKQIIDPG